MDKKIKFYHPSACGYRPNSIYSFDEVSKSLNKYAIKEMFIPVDFKWEDVFPEDKVEKKDFNKFVSKKNYR